MKGHTLRRADAMVGSAPRLELKSPPPVLRKRETDALERSDDVLRLCELKRPPEEWPLEVEVL